MSAVRIALMALAGLSLAARAFAQTVTPPLQTGPSGAEVKYNTTVDRGCFLGPPSANLFAFGTLVDTTGPQAGRLRSSLSAPSITLPDSWCNFNDNALTVTAQPIIASNVPVPPAGFSRLVNFRASATGWRRSGVAITATTNSGPNTAPGAGSVSGTGTESLYRVADIGLSVDQLATAGPTVDGLSPLLIASQTYQGSVIVSIGPALPPAAPETLSP